MFLLITFSLSTYTACPDLITDAHGDQAKCVEITGTIEINILNENNIEYETHSISLTTYKGKLDLVEPERQLFQIKAYKKESK